MWSKILYYIVNFGSVAWYITSLIWFIHSIIKIFREESLNNQAKNQTDRIIAYKKKASEEQDTIFAILKIKTQFYKYVGVTIIGGGAVSGIFSQLAQEYLKSPIWGLWLIGIAIASYCMVNFANIIWDDFVYFNIIQVYRNSR